ncbi:MAG: hypothetical protein V3V14_08160 [Saprospiraceae bacterium]
MKNFLILLFAITIISCSKDEPIPDPIPSKVLIKRIQVTGLPAVENNGTNWDFDGTRPDVYMRASFGYTSNILVNYNYSNVEFTVNTIVNYNQAVDLWVFDKDQFNDDDYICGITFDLTPKYRTTSMKHLAGNQEYLITYDLIY